MSIIAIKMDVIRIKNLAEMTNFAGRIAEKGSRAPGGAAPSAILLSGDLGAGKTEFARAFVRTKLGDPSLVVPSPTFTIVQNYDGISHYDLYRIKSPAELEEIGFFDAIQNDIVLIEWPERVEDLLPKNAIRINIEQYGDDRVIVVD
jgi:tRNA threonylcarbamoyl adenosine modification protein YjeE